MSRIDSWHRKISTSCHFQNGHHNTAQIQHCLISWWNHFNQSEQKSILLVQHKFFIQNVMAMTTRYDYNLAIMKSPKTDFNDISYVGRLWCPEMIHDIEKISTGRHFQNGRHNTAQIQHCPNSTPFHMWVDCDVPNWFLTSKNIWNGIEIGQCWICAVLWRPFWRWRSVEIFQCRDIIIYPHIKFRHNTAQIQHCPISMTFHTWVDYDVPNLFLTLKNF
jgi:hypothetical protein